MNKTFNYSANKVKFLLVPILIVLAGVVMYFVHGGFNFDVEFVGGTRFQFTTDGDVDNKELQELIKNETALDAIVQKSTTDDSVIVKIPSTQDDAKDDENKTTVQTAIAEKYDLSVADINPQQASASFGKQVQTKAFSFTLLAILCMLIYIIIRFEWRSAIMAVMALAINVLIMIAVYAISNIALNTTFIAAMLTVVGYSINNTIVIFDRIRENSKSRRRTESISEMVNRSIGETLGRTVNSTITTLITIVLIYILGVSTIKQFALPLIIGIVAGAYTSIFIASTFWAAWKEANAEAKAAAAAERRKSSKKNK